MRVLSVILVLVLLCTMITPFSMTAMAETPDDPSAALVRISADERCGTAAAISASGFASAENVVIASGDNYADALSGVPLAYSLDAPVLLVRSGGISKATLDEIKRLGPKKVFILGGEASVSRKCADELIALGYSVVRIAGNTRYQTAALIAEKLSDLRGVPKEIFVVSGENYPDALGVGSVAAINDSPILYSPQNGTLDSATAEFIKENAAPVKIIGGTSSVSEAAGRNIKDLTGLECGRIGGADRYETDLLILGQYASVLNGDAAVIATGANYPDALAGGVFAAAKAAPIVLTGSSLTDAQEDYLFVKAPSALYVLGGEAAVSQTAADRARYCAALGRSKVSTAADSEKAAAIVDAMSIEQKVGQMIMPAFRTWSDTNEGTTSDVTTLNDSLREAIKKYGFGGFILFSENTVGTEQTARLVYDLQQTSSDGLSKMNMLMSIDQEGGRVIRLKTGTNTCGSMALGALGSSEYAAENAAIIGSELAALGINTDFAPSLDVNSNPANPIIGVRSFSSSPELAGRLGAAYINGLHSEGVAAAAKHFPGHGDTSTDSHTGLPLISKTYDELKNFELLPFAEGIAAGADIIMTAHIQFPNIEKQTYKSISTGEQISLPATLSKTIITDILRGDLGFDGVVTTDAMNMGALVQNITREDAAVLAINADVDILLMPVDVTCPKDIETMGSYIDMIVSAVESGRIDEAQITDSAERIVKLKLERDILYGSDESVESIVAEAKSVVGSKEHHDRELVIAEKAVTLLKNDNSTLPVSLSDDQKALALYPYDGEQISLGYAVDRLKASGVIPAGAQVDICGYQSTTVDSFEEQLSAASAILLYTESYGQEYMDENSSSGWQAKFADALIEKAHSLGKKVVIISSQLPYDAARYQSADAILLSYCAKDMAVAPTEYNGEVRSYGVNFIAVTDVIFGGASPEGKVPVDIPALDSSRSFTEEILYPFGFGLSY